MSDVDRVERLWREGHRSQALAVAREVGARGEALELAEALLRGARLADVPEWEAAARLAVQLRERAWPPGHPRAGYAAMPLADLLRQQGRLAEAESILRESESLAEAGAAGGDATPLRDAIIARARLHQAQRRWDDAEAALLRAADIEAAGRHRGRPPFTLPLTELRVLYSQQGRHAEAAAVAERELALYEPGQLTARDEAVMRLELARALLAAGRAGGARAELARARRVLSGTVDPSDPLLATIGALLTATSQELE